MLFCVQRVGVMLGAGVGVGVQFTFAKGYALTHSVGVGEGLGALYRRFPRFVDVADGRYQLAV